MKQEQFEWVEHTVNGILSQYEGKLIDDLAISNIQVDLNKKLGVDAVQWNIDKGKHHVTFDTTMDGKTVSLTYKVTW